MGRWWHVWTFSQPIVIVGALTGALLGALLGSPGIGVAVGAIFGLVVGVLLGNRIFKSFDPTKPATPPPGGWRKWDDDDKTDSP